MSPYIVTTIDPKGATDQDADGRSFYVPASRRRAVATLEEAQEWVRDTVNFSVVSYGAKRRLMDAACVIPESGGTVTLPDGTVIEVSQVSWATLSRELGGKPWSGGETLGAHYDRTIDAFNAREVSS